MELAAVHPDARLELIQQGQNYMFCFQDPEGQRLFISKAFATAALRNAALVKASIIEESNYQIQGEGPYQLVLFDGSDAALGKSRHFPSSDQAQQLKTALQQAVSSFELLPEKADSLSTSTEYRFVLQFIEAQNQWSVRIEYPHGQEKALFEEVDWDKITAYIEHHLPREKAVDPVPSEELVSAPSELKTEAAEPKPVVQEKLPVKEIAYQAPTEQLRLEVLQDAFTVGQLVDRMASNILLKVSWGQNLTPTKTNQLKAEVTAQSMGSNQRMQVGSFNGPLTKASLEIPLRLTDIPDGLYRFTAKVTGEFDNRSATLLGNRLLQLQGSTS